MGDLKSFRKVDESTYRAFKAAAAAEGRPVGEVLNDAMLAYLDGARPRAQAGVRLD